jgi:hypothetical protein
VSLALWLGWVAIVVILFVLIMVTTEIVEREKK